MKWGSASPPDALDVFAFVVLFLGFLAFSLCCWLQEGAGPTAMVSRAKKGYKEDVKDEDAEWGGCRESEEGSWLVANYC